MIRFYLVCLPYWIFVDYIFVRLNLTYLPAKRFFIFLVMITNNKKWRSTSWLTMFNSLFSFPTFLLFSPFRLVKSNTWVQWKHLTPERSIDLCLQTFPKLLLLLVPRVTTRSLYPECIANLKLPIDTFYREVVQALI